MNNGCLQSMTFGNGQAVGYSYDRFDRLMAEAYAGGSTYHYAYDAEGSLARQTATSQSGAVTEAYIYDYDSLERLIHSKETDGNGQLVQRTEHLYDTSDRLTAQNWMLSDGMTGSQTYTCRTEDDTLSTLSSQVILGNHTFQSTVSYTYNTLRQLTRKTTDSLFYRAYACKAGME